MGTKVNMNIPWSQLMLLPCPEMLDTLDFWLCICFRVSMMILSLDKYKKQLKIADVHRDGRIKKRTQTRVSRDNNIQDASQNLFSSNRVLMKIPCGQLNPRCTTCRYFDQMLQSSIRNTQEHIQQDQAIWFIPPKICGLPKIHKPQTLLRPIVSCIGVPFQIQLHLLFHPWLGGLVHTF